MQVPPEHVSPSSQQSPPHGTGHGPVLARVQVPAPHASALLQHPSPQTTSPGSQQRPLGMHVLPAEQHPPGRSWLFPPQMMPPVHTWAEVGPRMHFAPRCTSFRPDSTTRRTSRRPRRTREA
jgi:hypothetical protein